MVDFRRKDIVRGIFLSGSSLDLNVGFHAERCIERNDLVTAWNVETFLCDTCADEDTLFSVSELVDFSELGRVLFFSFQQKLRNFGIPEPVEFTLQILRRTLCRPHRLLVVLQIFFVLFVDQQILGFSRRIALIRHPFVHDSQGIPH